MTQKSEEERGETKKFAIARTMVDFCGNVTFPYRELVKDFKEV